MKELIDRSVDIGRRVNIMEQINKTSQKLTRSHRSDPKTGVTDNTTPPSESSPASSHEHLEGETIPEGYIFFSGGGIFYF